MKKIRIGIAGCGMIFDTYISFFKHLDSAELYAIIDPDRDKLKTAKNMHNISRAYTSFDESLKDDAIDAYILASPVFVHEEQTIKAAKAGKHILCEKPMAATIEECDRMIEACRVNKVKLMVAYMKRFNQGNRIVKELIESGEIGELFYVSVHWDHCYPLMKNWRIKLESKGGVFQDHGSHTTDLVCWWLGSEVDTVSGDIKILSPEYEVEDLAICTLQHKNGALSIHRMSGVTHWEPEETYELHGTKASVIVRWPYFSSLTLDMPKIYLYKSPGRCIDLTGTMGMSWNLDKTVREKSQYLLELQHFCDCIINNREPMVTGEDGRKSMEIVNALYLSSWTGTKVKLPLKESPDLDKIFREIKKRETKMNKGWDEAGYDDGEYILKLKEKLAKKGIRIPKYRKLERYY